MPPAPPHAGGLPLLGALPSFLHDPLATLRHARTVGDVSRLKLGFIDAVTLHHAEPIDHVLRARHRNYTKAGPFWSVLRSILGNGLPVSEGHTWRLHRRMMQPQFHRQRIAGLANLVIDAIDDHLRWTDVGEGWRTIDVGARMPHLTMSVASAALLGQATSQRRAQVVASEFGYALNHMFLGMVTHRLPRWLPMPGRRRFQQSLTTLRREARALIEERRRQTEAGDDLLGLLIAATDDQTGQGMTDAQLLDETVSLLLAGYETTATALQWSLALLGQHPEIWGRLREECDAVLGGRRPQAEDLRCLRYARQVVQESLRLFPPSWWLPRVAAEDDEIGGYPIPAGTVVAPIMYTVHRHPDLWAHPERFDPERFEPSRSADRHPMAWCPFGAGPRKCIAQELALMEATMTLAIMTQRYDLAFAGHVPRPEPKVTLRPADGVRLRIRHRRPRWQHAFVPGHQAADSSSALAL
ncbi:MAG: cytochrome P450 [Myxococcota bacterium]